MLSAFQNVLRLLMYLIADAVSVRSGSGNQKIQRLHSGITGTFSHDIKEFSVRLRMKFVKHNPVDVEAVFAVCLSGKHLIKAVCWNINDAFLRCKDFHSLVQCRTHTNHIRCHIKYNGCLLTICGTAVDFGSFFTVTTGKQECNSCGKF